MSFLIHLLIHSATQQALLGGFYVIGSFPDTGSKRVNKARKNLAFSKYIF
jgi:hypothetical protein